MKRANTMSTITVELIIEMKTKFTSSNAEKTNGFISPQMSNFHTLYGRHVSTSFLDPVFRGHDEAGLLPNTKSLAAECLVGVRLELLNFLTPVCVD